MACEGTKTKCKGDSKDSADQAVVGWRTSWAPHTPCTHPGQGQPPTPHPILCSCRAGLMFSNKDKRVKDLPGGPMKTVLLTEGVWAQSLVRDLRLCMLCGHSQTNKQINKQK